MRKLIDLAPRCLVLLGAIFLTGSSASLGAYYGYQIGAAQLPLLGVVFAVAALGGELMKPFSVAAAIRSFGAGRPLTGGALALLGAVCILYSVAGELSLAAGGRGDLTARREQASDAYRGARDRARSLEAELTGLGQGRALPAVQGELQTARLDRLYLRSQNCTDATTSSSRQFCATVAALEAEEQAALARERLQSELKLAQSVASSAPATGSADPLATALVAYATALGWHGNTDGVSQWLALVPVVFLEVGSALAVVAVQSVSVSHRVSEAVYHETRPLENLQTEAAPRPETPETRPPLETPSVSQAILHLVSHSGGGVHGTLRSIAKAAGMSHSTLSRVVRELVEAKHLELRTTKQGTTLRLPGSSGVVKLVA